MNTEQVLKQEKANKVFYFGVFGLVVGALSAYYADTLFGTPKAIIFVSIALMVVGFLAVSYGAKEGTIFKR